MNGQTLSKAFVPLPAGAQAVYTSLGLTYYRHADWLGSSRVASTPARTCYYDFAYAPFGETFAYSQLLTCNNTDYDFTGQNQDTVNSLDDFLYREYAPTQGRWISPDPAGVGAVDPSNPQTWNRYAYVANNPLNRIDPTGLDMCLDGVCVLNLSGGGAWGGMFNGLSGGGVAMMTYQVTVPGSWSAFDFNDGYGVEGGEIQSPDSYYYFNVPVFLPGFGIFEAGTLGGGPHIRPDREAAKNGLQKPKSPAHQQCEANAQQKYANAKAAVPGITARGALVGAGVAVTGQAVAGCALGAGAGTILGGLATTFLGGEGAFVGAPVGCFTGGVSAVLEGLPQTALYAVVGGGVTYLWENHVANSELQQDMQACSQIP